ncbi:thermonuclease family protein [Desulfomonile tiedjei]|uniref:Micrococcal nuclease-like nuclease n=1 Tax=Desulfomonile tiedjei (strain ATCC 49306 / DSM 6799 / DCB-1) TaxID=706587 RepID=I4CDT7_DESTA|nr:thermonuclease family protein [Desulfomonile tiedjei]AFM27728.1 micrococcal nuclease-like nuclease [Desulfomonile tiedjei DSM 6799]
MGLVRNTAPRITSRLWIIFLCLFPTAVFSWSGKCVAVTDGDTISVMHHDTAEKIRLYGIDCPEGHQAFGNRAKHFTSNMVFGKLVEIEPVATDRYGRTVAWVIVDGKSVNKELVRAGMAWWFQKYAPDDSQIRELEKQARNARVGLWGDPNPVPPWEFRRPQSLHKKIKEAIQANNSIIYHGNIKSQVFHGPSCKAYDCKNCVVNFNSRESAISAGYKPCGTCRP